MSELSAVDQPNEMQLVEAKMFDSAEYLRDQFDFKYVALVGDIGQSPEAPHEYVCEAIVDGTPIVLVIAIDSEICHDVEDWLLSLRPFDRRSRDLHSGSDKQVQLAHFSTDAERHVEYESMTDQTAIIDFIEAQRATLSSQVHGRRALGKAFSGRESYSMRPAFSGISRLSWADSPESLEIVDACVGAFIGGMEAERVRLDAVGTRIRGRKIGDAGDREHLFAVGVWVDGLHHVVEFSCSLDRFGVVETFAPRYDRANPVDD